MHFGTETSASDFGVKGSMFKVTHGGTRYAGKKGTNEELMGKMFIKAVMIFSQCSQQLSNCCII